jgi:hypothetical protein
MKLVDPTKPHRKSGGWAPADWLRQQRPQSGKQLGLLSLLGDEGDSSLVKGDEDFAA